MNFAIFPTYPTPESTYPRPRLSYPIPTLDHLRTQKEKQPSQATYPGVKVTYPIPAGAPRLGPGTLQVKITKSDPPTLELPYTTRQPTLE